MERLIADLEDYLERTPEDQKKIDWKELEKYSRPETINCITVLVGRFQPFTITDLENIEKLYAETGNPVQLVYVRSHQGYANTPFRSSTVRRMLEKIRDAYPEKIGSVIRADTWETWEFLEKHGIYAAKSMESDHNSVKASIARLALSLDSKEEFCKVVPECLHGMYGDLVEEIKNMKWKKR